VRTLRGRLILAMLVASLVVAAVILFAVHWFSTERIAQLLMDGVASQAEAEAMVDEYIGRVVAIGAIAGVALGWLTAWWLVRRVLRPLGRVAEGTRQVAAGHLSARVPEPQDEELQEVARAFNRMAETLERTERLRTALIEDVAHELRTPLTTLRGYTEALADGVADPTPEMLFTVHAEIERLTRLIEGLDMLARGDGERTELARVEIDLGELVRRSLALAAPALASRDIVVRVDAGADLPRLLADPDGIGQVLANLIQNAARYTADRGQIVVSLSSHPTRVTCAIANTGPDIPASELPAIWERLHRVDQSRSRATGGAGIGLAIVRQIVERHGGTVGARSGGGRTEVWFSLPIVREPA
jgi:two-component system, OmpR family, sensor histidine kinase BaeS